MIIKYKINMLSTSEIIKKYNLYTKKSFGQNFLTQKELLNKIVSYAGDLNNYNVLEIGTGPAGLTTAILENNPKKLITIDADERCVDIAKIEIKPCFDNLEVVFADALTINEKELFNNNNFKIIANLPYNIGTTLLFKWLENCIESIDNITLLLQKEVVERMVAKNNTKDYGRLSVMCQYLCDVKKCFDISPQAFFPPPKVISSVVSLTPKKDINTNTIKPLSNLCKLLFNQRRKTIYNNLKSQYKNAEFILQKCNIDKNIRVEQLEIKDFINILNNLD